MTETNDVHTPLLSIIVPVYNTEPYLAECLDSLCNQTLRDIEIICVNDGSTDGSLEVLRKYEKEDARVRVIDQKNQGVSVARNNGATTARGKYLYFMDSDDRIDACLGEYGVRLAEENQCEVVNIRTLADCRQGFNIPYVRKLENQIRFQESRVYRNISSQQREFFQYVSGGPYHNVVLREAWKKYEISFPEGVAINEDYYVWFLLYSQMASIAFLFPEKALFFARWRPNSASGTALKKRKNGKSKAWDQFRVFDILQKRFIEKEAFDSYRALAVRYLTTLYYFRFMIPRNERWLYNKEVRKIWNERITSIIADPEVLPLGTRVFWLGIFGDRLTKRLVARFMSFWFCFKPMFRETFKSALKNGLKLAPSKYIPYLPKKIRHLHKNAPTYFKEY